MWLLANGWFRFSPLSLEQAETMPQANPIQLNCPICQAMLSVSPDRAGERIACDQCGSRIKVPGQAATANEDDDWLRLESDLEPSPEPERRTPEPERYPPGPELGDGDDFMLPDLSNIPLSPLTGPRSVAPPPLSESDLEALSGFSDTEDQKPAPMKRVEPTVAVDQSFRVTCPTCDSLTYAKPNQVGKRIRCPDCHAAMVVPPPPKVVPKYQPDIQAAATYNFQDSGEENLPSRPTDPFRKSADDLLRAAEAAHVETEAEEWELPNFQQWFSGLAKVFLDPVVGLHIFFLSLLAFLPTAVAVQYESSIIVMGLFAGGAIFGALLVANGFAILQAVANGESEVSEWPLFDPMAWIGQMVIAIASVGVAAGPIWMVTHYIFQGGLVTVAMTMISLYLLYPIVLLSMLDEESILVPFSTDVTKSVMRAPDQWGAAYLASGILFFGMFLMFMIASVTGGSSPRLGAAIAIFVTVAGTFAYFGILGRLAYGIGHSVNAPPMVNDIQRDTKRKVDEV